MARTAAATVVAKAAGSHREQATPPPAPPAVYGPIRVDLVDVGFNPRIFGKDDTDLQELAASIRAQGLLEPIVVRPVGDRFRLIAGERRLRATKLAGLVEIDAAVREYTDRQALEATVTENLQREDLHPLEEASGVAALIAGGQDYREVARTLGKSLGWVAKRARLANLSPSWRALVANRKSPVSRWSGAHLELLAALDQAGQDHFLKHDGAWMLHRDAVTVDQLARSLAHYTRELRRFAWKLDDASLLPAAGACATCPKRSSHYPGLFDDAATNGASGKQKSNDAGDRCLDAVCFNAKNEAFMARRASELKAEHGSVVFVRNGYTDEKPPAFTHGKVEERHEFAQAKKGDAGAVPLLVVAGDGVGTISFGKRAQRVFDQRTQSYRTTHKRDKGETLSLADRKKAYALRRKALAIELIRKAVDDHTKPPAADVVFRLAAIFGTTVRHDGGWHDNGSRPAAAAGLWKAFDAATRADAVEQLWRSTRPVLASRLSERWCPNQERRAEQWPDAERIARILGADPKHFTAAALKALPDPKAWAKQAAAADTNMRPKSKTALKTKKATRKT